ncbi:sugar transport system permease [Paenibacillus cisolokensis]|uniref:Sugar transport system permease n=1 Tax=Paenibacillus cisolokensis TaxID=1658519 RepID=A0ABQ4N1M4_9BACL|nr:ABC transporter permease [Paenibacillus cisolokensis]GIQ62075.1 sugar transport system permease [Paenibacillus cisolokensis]
MFNLLRQLAAIGIISMGMLLVILTGGIDLSVGAFAALGCVISAVLLADYSFPVAVILTILTGLALGCLSGYLVAKRNIAPFISTLAMMTIANGLAFIISKGSPIMVNNRAMELFDRGYFLGIPLHVCVMFIVFLITVFVLRSTVFGRMIKAIGSNESAVTLSGVKTDFYKMAVYCIAGGLSVIGGIIITSRTGVGSPLIGSGLELDAIAAVVIGGASLNGGRGTALNTLLGVFILGLIGNIMNLMNVPAYPQQVIKGLIIIAAVMFQVVNKKRA